MAACGVSKCGPVYPDRGDGDDAGGAAADVVAAGLGLVTGRCVAAGARGLAAAAGCADCVVLAHPAASAHVMAAAATTARRRDGAPRRPAQGAARPAAGAPGMGAVACPRYGTGVFMMSPCSVTRGARHVMVVCGPVVLKTPWRGWGVWGALPSWGRLPTASGRPDGHQLRQPPAGLSRRDALTPRGSRLSRSRWQLASRSR